MREHINDAEVENVLSAIRKLIVEGRPEPQREGAPSPLLLTPALRVGGGGASAPLEPLVLSAPIVAPVAAAPAPQPLPRAADAERESAVPVQMSAKPEAALSLDPPVAAAPAPVVQASWSNLVTLAQADARRNSVRKAEAPAPVDDAAPASPLDTAEPETPAADRLDDAALPIETSERPALGGHDNLGLHPASAVPATAQPTLDAPTTDATDEPIDPATTGATDDATTSVPDAPTAGATGEHGDAAPDAPTTDGVEGPTRSAPEPTPRLAERAAPEDQGPSPADLAAAFLPSPAPDDHTLPEPEAPAERPQPVAADLPIPDHATLRDLIRDILHEELSREIMAEVVRAELRGELDEATTRNLRKIVKQELQQALASRESA